MNFFQWISKSIESECEKIWTRITPNTDTFHAVFSIWLNISTSMPLGYVLGHLLFKFFINIFHFIETATLYNYADDTIYSSDKNANTVTSRLRHYFAISE